MAKDKSVHFDRKKNQFVGLSETALQQLKETYAGVDINCEIKKMELWLANKGKDRKGTIGFILNWLNNASAKPLTTTQQLDLMATDSPLSALLLTYLEPVWKKAENILAFNKIQR